MEVVVQGTAGPDGIPVTGCACPACLAAATGRGAGRSPAALLLDGDRRLGAGDAAEQVGADGDRLLWLPAADDLADPQLAGPDPADLEEGAGQHRRAARFALLGARTPSAAARALARLRAAGAVDDGTRCALVGVRHDWPPEAEVRLRARHWGVAIPVDGEPLGDPSGPAAQRLPRRTLVLGGTRSGKSALAEDLLAAEPAVVYLAATDGAGSTDDEWARRVAAHRARRPAWWRTVESTDLAAAVGAATADGAPVLLDSTGSWLAAVLGAAGAWDRSSGWRERYLAERDRFVQAWRAVPVPLVAVAEEVGLSLLPDTASGRLFTDELGRLHQLLAASSEQVLQCVAGRTVVLVSPAAGRTASSTGTDPRAGA